MIRLVGKDGLTLVSAFNGDDFEFVVPKIYVTMTDMVKRIDEYSFAREKLAFKNKLGYYSQWFTQNQLLGILHTDTKPSLSGHLLTATLTHLVTFSQIATFSCLSLLQLAQIIFVLFLNPK